MLANPTVGSVQEPAESQFKSKDSAATNVTFEETYQALPPIGLMAREVFFHLGPTGHTTSGSASNIAVAGYDESIWQSAAIQTYPVAVFTAGSAINVGYDPIRAMAKLANDYEQRNVISQYHPAIFRIVGPSVELRLATPAASHAISAESLEHRLELDWLEANLEKVYSHQGRWLALGPQGIIAVADSMRQVAQLAEAHGYYNSLLFHVPSLDENVGDIAV